MAGKGVSENMNPAPLVEQVLREWLWIADWHLKNMPDDADEATREWWRKRYARTSAAWKKVKEKSDD